MNRLLACCFAITLLVGCSKQEQQPVVDTLPVSSSSSSFSSSATSSVASSQAQYTFEPVKSKGGGVYDRGASIDAATTGRALLFFGRTGDPFTERSDRMLRSLYASGSIAISTRYAEYSPTLRLVMDYNVVTHDTFVLLDETGNPIKNLVHPSEVELRTLLK